MEYNIIWIKFTLLIDIAEFVILLIREGTHNYPNNSEG